RPQRKRAKARRAVERVGHETAERLLRLACGALLAVVRYVGRREPDPRPQAGKETVALGQLVKRLDGGAPEHAKGASLRLDRVIGQPAQNRVKQIEARATQPSVGARAARRAHYFRAVPPPGVALGAGFW